MKFLIASSASLRVPEEALHRSILPQKPAEQVSLEKVGKGCFAVAHAAIRPKKACKVDRTPIAAAG